jgi:TctA family transporter
VLVQRPISAVLLGLSVLLLIMVISPAISKRREMAFQE